MSAALADIMLLEKPAAVQKQPAGRPRVVIIGAGFAGIAAARALRRADVGSQRKLVIRRLWGLKRTCVRILGVILAVLLLTAEVAAAEEVRQTEFANALVGNWAPTIAVCQAQAGAKITISEIVYNGPDRTCGVLWIVESPASRGINYSIHGLCVDTSQPSKSDISDLIIQTQSKDKIMVGRSFADLKSYYRCPTT